MENVDVLIRALEPEIDKKCAEIKKRKSDRVLTRVFISIAAMLLVVPEVLIFFGISVIAIFVPFIFVSFLVIRFLFFLLKLIFLSLIFSRLANESVLF